MKSPSEPAQPSRERIAPDPTRPPELRSPWPYTDAVEPLPEHWIPDRYLEHPQLDIETWRAVWSRDLSFPIRSHRGLMGKLVVWFKKLVRPLVRTALADLYERERVFQLALLDTLARERTVLEELRQVYQFLRGKTVPDLVARMDAMFGILDRRLDGLEALQHEADKQAAARERWLRKRLESPAAAPAVVPAQEASAGPAPEPAATAAAGARLSDEAYVAFEERHRGPEQEIRQRQAMFVELIHGGPVVDLGAGRGEFLELLRDAGIEAYGVDANVHMVDRALAKGLDVRHADALEHLASLPDSSLGGIFCAQTVEHWSRPVLFAAAELMHRKLVKGGRLIIETQNPTSLLVGGSEFWRDVTHVAPVHPDALRFVAEAVGFQEVELRFLAPFGEQEYLETVPLEALEGEARRVAESLNGAVVRLNKLLFGFRDYALVASK